MQVANLDHIFSVGRRCPVFDPRVGIGPLAQAKVVVQRELFALIVQYP